MTTTSRPESSDRVSDDDPPSEQRRLRIVFVAWRDLVSPQAGGSELLIEGLVSCGGTYSQYLRAPPSPIRCATGWAPPRSAGRRTSPGPRRWIGS
jgi:hypothetical protein